MPRTLTSSSCPLLLQTIKDAIGPLPLFHEKAGGDDDAENDDTNGKLANGGTTTALPASHRPAVLADGSYATQVCWIAHLQSFARCVSRAGVAIQRHTGLLGLHTWTVGCSWPVLGTEGLLTGPREWSSAHRSGVVTQPSPPCADCICSGAGRWQWQTPSQRQTPAS